jgi:sterol desaturase/sphingolipid hydroxylase (fatty acid hydroxylase superfamily)
MRRIVAWGLFPLTLLASLGGAVFALERGADAGVALGIGALGTWLVVVVFERLQPFRREWNRPQGDVGADLAYLPTTLGVNALVEPAVKVVAVALGAWISGAIGVGLWPATWPLAAQLVLACVIAEFVDYWPHRWMHQRPLLWRFHVIHHSPERLYWLNATRSHPVEMMFRGVFNFLPLALLGASGAVLALFALTTIVVGLFQHANIDFRLGPLAWIFSVGDMHRWHHSEDLAEASHNYGNNFLVWDVVFGTWFRPRDRRAPERLGIAGLRDFPRSWWAQLAQPFRAETT